MSHILCVGDRRADLAGGARLPGRRRASSLIVTSGGLGPTADDLTAEVVARFAGRELVLDERMEERDRRDHRRVRPPDAVRRRGAPRSGESKAGDGAERRRGDRSRGNGAGPRGARPTGPTVIVLPGPPRELHEMWPRALETAEARAVLEGLDPFSTETVRLFGIPESELAQTLARDRRLTLDLSPLEITTCLRRAELEVEIRHRPGAEDARKRAGGGNRAPATAASSSASTARRSTSRSPSC